MFCALHDPLASLGRHAQLKRCFSAVAELLVCIYSASISSSQSADKLNVSLLLQLAVTAMGLFTLLAVVIIAVVICRRSSASLGMCSLSG